MSDGTADFVSKLEEMLPKTMRRIFWATPDDPLAEITIAQLRLMRILEESESVTPSELSSELGLTMSAVTQMFNRLEQMHLVERYEDPSDRRVRRVRLSDEGREKMRLRREVRIHRAGSRLSHIPIHRQAEILDAISELLAAAKTADPEQDSIPPIS